MQNDQDNLLSIFEKQVELYPNHIAVSDEHEKFTYQQLDFYSTQLAYYLIELGVSPKQIIGICIPRSAKSVVSILAALKANSTFLPMNIDCPELRFSHAIEETNLSIIICDSKVEGKLPSTSAIVIPLDTVWPELKKETFSKKQKLHRSANTPTYIIYTSGSTGKPKGIVVNDQGLVQLVSHTNYIKINKEDKLLQLSPNEFDGAIFEIFSALLNGAHVTIFPPGIPTLEKLALTITNEKISILFITTQLFNAMVDNYPTELSKVKQVLFGGEAASPYHVKRFLKSAKNTRLINIYGTTEATVFSLFHEILTEDELDNIPIGKPITGTTIEVLNEHSEPVSIGETGELCLGGSGLANSYFKDDHLTQVKFTISPKGKRLFKTGDLVKINQDNDVVFIGRYDNQVKVRGYRVTTEEIETALKRLLEIKKTAVLPIPDKKSGCLDMVAFIEATDEYDLSLSDIRIRLKNSTPSYMLPTKVVKVKSIPLNRNGKTYIAELRSLYEEQLNQEEKNALNAAPLTLTEIALKLAWEEVLNESNIAPNDDFFDLGGHSLVIVSLIERLKHNKVSSIKNLEVIDFFNHPTISQLAEYADQRNP